MALTQEQIQEFDNITGLTPGNIQRGRIAELRALPKVEQPQKRSFFEKVADFTGGKEIAQGLGQAQVAGENAKMLESSQGDSFRIQGDLVNLIRQKKQRGEDTTRLQEALDEITTNISTFEAQTNQVLNPNELTNKQVLGDAVQLAGTVIGTGTLPGTGKASLASKSFIQGAKAAIPEATLFGAVEGGAQALQDDKSFLGGLARGAAFGAAGGLVLGGALGGVSGKLSARASKIAQSVDSDLEKFAGQIAQGKKKDIPKVIKAISQIETDGIKTYQELVDTIEDKISGVASALDKRLLGNTTVSKLDDLALKKNVNGTEISKNYVDEALTQLEDLFNKTNDPVKAAEVQQLRAKAQNEGLTIKEINDIARVHGKEINAFNASGEAASGLSKQAAENTRKGLKDTARELFGDEAFKQADDQLSALIRTRKLVSDVNEKVNNLKQRIIERGFGERVGRFVYNVANQLTGGGLKGFLQSALVPRGQGYKVLNALDLENMLQKNLKNLNKAINAKTEQDVIRALRGIIDQSAELPASQPNTSSASKTAQNVDIPKQNKALKNKYPAGFVDISFMAPERIDDLATKLTTLSESQRFMSLDAETITEVENILKLIENGKYKEKDLRAALEILKANGIDVGDGMPRRVLTGGVDSDLISEAKKYKSAEPITSLNPTGGILVEYTPQARMTAPLGENMTTLANSMQKNPNTLITVYRGAPKTQKSINPGDFISTDINSALSYAENGNVISKRVRLGDILDDIDEPLGGDYLYRPGAFDEIGTKVRDITKSEWYNNYLNYLKENLTEFKNLNEWLSKMKASGKTKSQLEEIWKKANGKKK